MAQYKVLQDIEAEDKLVGPFSLRQFIYAGIVIVLGFISFRLIPVNPFLVIPFIPPMLFFGLLAAPIGTEQSSEIWLLAKVRFFLKPHKRVWNQNGMQQLVTITAPKKVERNLTDNLSQTEVKSRLKALSTTLDSRGWAVKGAEAEAIPQPGFMTGSQVSNTDRLIGGSSLPDNTNTPDEYGDIMDSELSPTARNLEDMLKKSTQTNRQALVQNLKQTNPPQDQQQNDYWFMNQPQTQQESLPGYTTFHDRQSVTPKKQPKRRSPSRNDDALNEAEQALLSRIHEEQKFKPKYKGKIVNPVSNETPEQTKASKNQNKDVKANVNPDILRLADNDDLNVATIAREAKRVSDSDDEVMIPLR